MWHRPFTSWACNMITRKKVWPILFQANHRALLLKLILFIRIGTHSIFESPTRQPFPALREPNSQPFLFSQPTSTAPSSRQNVTFGNPSFTTPRKVNLDFSSGGENASSPEIADNEETPEQPTRREKRNSLFGMYGRWAPSPGRGEIPRLTNYSNALARRVEKRRRRDRGIDRRLRRDSEGDSDADRKASQKELEPQKHQQEPTKPSRFASFSDFFALIEAHPNVPSILSWWAQLVVNLSLFSLATYVVFAFVSAIRSEFDQAAEEVSDTILAEMAVCARNYVDNRCAGGERLPALETVCDNWERCMNRDPAKVGRAKVSAHTMAIIINSFIDPISWKAIVSSAQSPYRFSLGAILRNRSTEDRKALFFSYHFNGHRGQQLVLSLISYETQPTRIYASKQHARPTPSSDSSPPCTCPATSILSKWFQSCCWL